MTFNYDFTEEDLFRWYQHTVRASPRSHIARRKYLVSWFVIYTCLAVAAVVVFKTGMAAFVAFGLVAVYTFSTWRGYDQRVDAALRAQAAEPHLKGGFGPVQLTLSEVGLREVTPTTDSTVKWQSVVDVLREDDYVFARLANGHAAVIPRRSYSGPIAFEEIPKIINDFKQRYYVEPDAASPCSPATSFSNSHVMEEPPSAR